MDFFYAETLIVLPQLNIPDFLFYTSGAASLSLNPKVVKAILDGLCIPDGVTPPIHCIEPLTSPVSMVTLGLPDSNLDSLLLGEFLEQTKKRDLVVENWAPRVEVLSNDLVGEKLSFPYIYHLSLA
ncbi:hypothetical protein TorRG33x02_008030 [Trema orientale]|uniref:UDP-glucuronosyl/UDP-glucosyltransferase n=1 Tax=Trema orientale TaxID=63057 RepID=A0A2P5G0L2_TREOI|nr:hypothetical protein TorRG33x02_008030 [Trema orientale]